MSENIKVTALPATAPLVDVEGKIDTRIGIHNDLATPHGLATSFGGKPLGLADGNLAILPIGVDGQILKRGATAWEAGAAPAGAGGGNLVLMEDISITTPITTLLISGLDINRDGNYLFIVELTHALPGGPVYHLFINEDTNNVNYRRQELGGNGASVSAVRLSSAYAWHAHYTGFKTCFGWGLIGLINGMYHCFGAQSIFAPVSGIVQHMTMRHITQQVNITSFRITSTQANGIGVGSRIKLYRL